jgi:hypothetical protein
MIIRLNNEKQSVLAPERRLQNIGLQKMRRGPIYNKNYVARSCASALERSHSALDRTYLRSRALNRSIFPRHNSESDGARAMRESWVYVACA